MIEQESIRIAEHTRALVELTESNVPTESRQFEESITGETVTTVLQFFCGYREPKDILCSGDRIEIHVLFAYNSFKQRRTREFSIRKERFVREESGDSYLTMHVLPRYFGSYYTVIPSLLFYSLQALAVRGRQLKSHQTDDEIVGHRVHLQIQMTSGGMSFR